MDPVLAALDLPAARPAVDVGVLVRRTHQLLAAGVPLTLLLDLADPSGPRSAARFASESADVDWVPRPR